MRVLVVAASFAESGSVFVPGATTVTAPPLDVTTEANGWRTVYPRGRATRPDVWLFAKQASTHPAWVWAQPAEAHPDAGVELERIYAAATDAWTFEELRADDGTAASAVKAGWINEAPASAEPIALYNGIGTANRLRLGGTPAGNVVVNPPSSGGAGGALNTALSGLKPGAVVVLKAGTYVLNSDVVVPSGVTLVADGAVTVELGTSNQGWTCSNTDGVTFIGFTFDLAATGNFRTMIIAEGAKNLRVESCVFVNTGSTNPEWTLMAVLAINCQNVQIVRCHQQGCQYKGGGEDASGFYVLDCTVDTAVQYAVSFVTRFDGATQTRRGNIRDLRVERMTLVSHTPGDSGIGLIYVGDDATATFTGASSCNDVVIRDIRVDVPALIAEGSAKGFMVVNCTHNDFDNWLIEDVNVTLENGYTLTTAVRIDPRDRSGPGATVGRLPTCSNLIIRRVSGVNVGRLLTWNWTKVSGVFVLQDIANVGTGATWRGDDKGWAQRSPAQLLAEFAL